MKLWERITQAASLASGLLKLPEQCGCAPPTDFLYLKYKLYKIQGSKCRNVSPHTHPEHLSLKGTKYFFPFKGSLYVPERLVSEKRIIHLGLPHGTVVLDPQEH